MAFRAGGTSGCGDAMYKDAFEIPADFVNERVVLEPEELVWGFRNGWVSAEGAVRVCVHAWNVTGAVDPITESIALLLSGEEEHVTEIVDPVRVSVEWVSYEAQVWLFLAVAYVHANWDALDDPHERLASIFADFEYTDEMSPSIRFMPYTESGEPPAGYVESRLAEYVAKKSELYGNRTD